MARTSADPNHTDLQGTLDLLILRTLLFGPVHGQGIANSIEKTSDDILQIDHGSLYPALQRLQARGWIRAKWGISENNRRDPSSSASRSSETLGQPTLGRRH